MTALKKHNGFTLIELILVIVILGIISAVVYINWSPSSLLINQQAAIFANNIRYAQNLSITKNERCKLVIHIGESEKKNTYQILNKKGIPLNIPQAGKSAKLADGITIDRLGGGGFFDPKSKKFVLIFDGRGRPLILNIFDKPSRMQGNFTITLKDSTGRTKEIIINGFTGRVSVKNRKK